MEILHKLIAQNWLVIDEVNVLTIPWCKHHLGWEYSKQHPEGRWYTAYMRVHGGTFSSSSTQWFCAFKTAEDLVWYRMHFDCTVVDMQQNIV